MSNSGLLGNFMGGPGTGALGGPPTGHNYKRAVYRPPPRDFTVEVIPPTKFGSGYCYGMRICPTHALQSDVRSTRSGAFAHEYEVWRRWEDCLWFQEILEGEYTLMARQKRTRLAAGKGVKKNGVYIHSDQAASFESLPPGPDVNSIAKDIHDIIPRLTKKGTLFRASQATIEQRGHEFEAMINALFQDDVPMLIQELRETRLVRDFFGYWRRDLDHERKQSGQGSVNGSNPRHSVANSTFSMYFSPSSISVNMSNGPYPDLPPSPALPNFQGPRSPDLEDSSRRNSMQRAEPRRRSGGRAPVSYATSDSSASTVSVASSSRGGVPQSPQTPAQDLTFYVSERGSLALNIVNDDDEHAEYINTPLSAPARVRPFPVPEDEAFARDEHVVAVAASAGKGKARQDGPTSVSMSVSVSLPSTAGGLQALPEDSEFVPTSATTAQSLPSSSEIEEVPRVPQRRPRNNSCPDRSVRQCLFIPADAPRSAHVDGAFSTLSGLHESLRIPLVRGESRRPGSRDSDNEARPSMKKSNSNSSSSSRMSSAAFSSFSMYSGDHSRRSSWRTSMASETSFAQSFATSFANGSCADFDLHQQQMSRYSFATSYANGSCADLEPAADRGRQDVRRSSLSSISTSGRKTALGHRESMTTLSSFLSDLSIDTGTLGRLTPPPTGTLRRSLSAGSRRPTSILAALGGQEDWYEQQDDFLDAYFYDPGFIATKQAPIQLLVDEPPRTPTPPLSPTQDRDPSAPREPALQQPFNKEVSTPDRFPKPFQNRPPGQFHLPWSVPSTPVPVRQPDSASTVKGSAEPNAASAGQTTPTNVSAGPISENVTLKAVLHDSIVLLRISRSAPLQEVRTRLRDKFAAQEGVQLSSAFAIGWAPSAGRGSGVGGIRGRPRSNSASSVGSMNPHALRYVYSEQEWRQAVAACAGGKMTIRLFNAQPL